MNDNFTKHIHISLFLLLFASVVIAQNKILEKSVLECRYKLVMQKDTVNKIDSVEDDMVLRIGKTTSQFFSRHTFYHDSLWADPDGRKKAEELSIESLSSFGGPKKFGHRTTKDYLYKNYPEGKMTTFTNDFLRVSFFYEEDYMPQEWIIADYTKQILGYTCKKAVCDFRGRHWIAWFAIDIPIKEGPWKLNGLPGLILEAYDSNKDYHYTVTGMDEKSAFLVTLYKFDDHIKMETERIIYNHTLEKYLMGADIEELDLLQEALKEGIPLKFAKRRAKKLRYDFLERDHLTR